MNMIEIKGHANIQKAFNESHQIKFTLYSAITKKALSYKIETKDELSSNYCRYFNILDGEGNSIGSYFTRSSTYYSHGILHASINKNASPTAKPFYWFIKNFDQLINNNLIKVFREPYCTYCGRKLSSENSLKRGYGTTCKRKYK